MALSISKYSYSIKYTSSDSGYNLNRIIKVIFLSYWYLMYHPSLCNCSISLWICLSFATQFLSTPATLDTKNHLNSFKSAPFYCIILKIKMTYLIWFCFIDPYYIQNIRPIQYHIQKLILLKLTYFITLI